MKPSISVILLILTIGSWNCQRSERNNSVFSVEGLKKSDQYCSKIVDVSGIIIKEYHGLRLCDKNETPCIFVWEPEADDKLELEKDRMYDEYKRLAVEVGLDPERLRKEKLFVTLRGRYEEFILSPNGDAIILTESKHENDVRCRFILQKVLKLDVRTIR
jgi:hypothetical protein